MIVEVAGLAALSGDQETDILANVAFPTPFLSDPDLAAEFVRLHTALDMPTTRLERDERLTVWLHADRAFLDGAPAAARGRPS